MMDLRKYNRNLKTLMKCPPKTNLIKKHNLKAKTPAHKISNKMTFSYNPSKFQKY